MGNNQHVTPHNNGWQVKSAGVTKTQKVAIKIARNIATNKKSEVIIHGTNGRIRQKNSYGNDPFPPRG